MPEAFAGDPDRLMRFEREVRPLAEINDPDIGQVYDVEETAGVNSAVTLVLEMVTRSGRCGAPMASEAFVLRLALTLPRKRCFPRRHPFFPLVVRQPHNRAIAELVRVHVTVALRTEQYRLH